MALKPFEWHFEMEKHLPVVNHGSQWESPAVWLRPAVPQRKSSVFSHCQSTETMLKISNFHAFLKCPGQREDFLSPIGLRGSGSPDLTGTLKKHNAHSCFVEAQLHCLYFPPSRWESGGRVGGLPAPAIRHPSAINRESQSVWFMRLALVASSNLASFKSHPSSVFYLLCKLIWRSFSPHWLVFRAPSPSRLLIP